MQRRGLRTGDVIQTDGSGLSRHDLVTPRAFVAVLEYAQKQPWFPAYLASLPVAGEDGTLNERMKVARMAGKIQAKTARWRTCGRSRVMRRRREEGS